MINVDLCLQHGIPISVKNGQENKTSTKILNIACKYIKLCGKNGTCHHLFF